MAYAFKRQKEYAEKMTFEKIDALQNGIISKVDNPWRVNDI
jgi:hypothetical protein